MKYKEEQIKELLQVAENPVLTDSLEYRIMQAVELETKNAPTPTLDTALRFAIVGTVFSIVLLGGLFIYGNAIFNFFNQFLGLPNLSNSLIPFSAVLILIIFFVQIDPIIRVILDRQYKKHAAFR